MPSDVIRGWRPVRVKKTRQIEIESHVPIPSERGSRQGIKKAPRARGFCLALEMSVGAAASIAPNGAVRTPATGPHHDDWRRHDDRTWTNHTGPAIGLA